MPRGPRPVDDIPNAAGFIALLGCCGLVLGLAFLFSILVIAIRTL